MGFVETFRKLMKKRKEATATGSGASLATPAADTTKTADKIGMPGEEYTEEELKAMGHTYGGTAPGRVGVLQQFLMKGKKKK